MGVTGTSRRKIVLMYLRGVHAVGDTAGRVSQSAVIGQRSDRVSETICDRVRLSFWLSLHVHGKTKVGLIEVTKSQEDAWAWGVVSASGPWTSPTRGPRLRPLRQSCVYC